jgi:hypothetical protein
MDPFDSWSFRKLHVCPICYKTSDFENASDLGLCYDVYDEENDYKDVAPCNANRKIDTNYDTKCIFEVDINHICSHKCDKNCYYNQKSKGKIRRIYNCKHDFLTYCNSGCVIRHVKVMDENRTIIFEADRYIDSLIRDNICYICYSISGMTRLVRITFNPNTKEFTIKEFDTADQVVDDMVEYDGIIYLTKYQTKTWIVDFGKADTIDIKSVDNTIEQLSDCYFNKQLIVNTKSENKNSTVIKLYNRNDLSLIETINVSNEKKYKVREIAIAEFKYINDPYLYFFDKKNTRQRDLVMYVTYYTEYKCQRGIEKDWNLNKHEYIYPPPIVRVVIDSKYLNKSKFDPTNQIECSICLEDFNSESTILPCLHKFHTICINRWKYQHTRCPCCRVCMYD